MTHSLYQDHLGTTSLQTTATGTWAGASFHAPFGDPWYRVGALATDRRYTGQRSLEGSLGSLYHYQARWYSPVLGRFLSPDPIVPEPGNPQALNRYSYVYNNPLLYTDPSGYCVFNAAGEISKFDCTIEDFVGLELDQRIRWLETFISQFSQGDWLNDILGILYLAQVKRSLGEDPGFILADAVVLAAINGGNNLFYRLVDGPSATWRGIPVEGMEEAAQAWYEFFVQKTGDPVGQHARTFLAAVPGRASRRRRGSRLERAW